MPCPEFEDLLSEGRGDHAARCQECRALLDALTRVDATFDGAFANIYAPPNLAVAVLAHVGQPPPEHSPSLIPEVLDLIGWAAVLAVAAIVAPRFATLLSSILAGLG